MIRALLIALLLSVVISSAQACSCMGITRDTAYRYADVVFSGVVTEESVVEAFDSAQVKRFLADSISLDQAIASMRDMVYRQFRRVIIQVSKRYKGQITESQLVVYTAIHEAECGVDFRVENRYIVYARGDEILRSRYNLPDSFPASRLYTAGLCSKTGLYSRAENQALIHLKNRILVPKIGKQKRGK